MLEAGPDRRRLLPDVDEAQRAMDEEFERARNATPPEGNAQHDTAPESPAPPESLRDEVSPAEVHEAVGRALYGDEGYEAIPQQWRQTQSPAAGAGGGGENLPPSPPPEATARPAPEPQERGPQRMENQPPRPPYDPGTWAGGAPPYGRERVREYDPRTWVGGAPAPMEAHDQGRRLDGLDPHAIIGDRPQRRLDWRLIDTRRYEGLEIKDLRAILANQSDAQLFGEALRAIDIDAGARALERYHEGNPTPDDIDLLTYTVHEYAYRSKMAEDINTNFNKEELELLARRDQNFLNLLSHEGNRSVDMAKGAVLHMAMRDPDGVEDLRAIYTGLKADRSTARYKRVEHIMDSQCRRLGIERRDYDAVVNLNSRSERKESLKDMAARIHERAGKFRRALDWTERHLHVVPVYGSSRSVAASIRHEAIKKTPGGASIRGFVTQGLGRRMDDSLQHVVDFIGPTLGNPEMRRLIAQEVLSNQNALLRSERGPRSFEQVQGLARNQFSPASIEQRIRARMAEPDWPADAGAQNAEIRSMRSAERRQHAGDGFWAWLFGALLNRNWNQGAQAALGRPVAA